eukprot:TRINITY_DN37722_c0_g1_i1.p1 TRINITY_DN37722_c0_g1~~TRINITY_DN37722_c0_g1_i1.p1  ORF type:complete len:418 (+),score=87.42 TRINITY_DN37722_c0_g1_i1:111-1364(+)
MSLTMLTISVMGLAPPVTDVPTGVPSGPVTNSPQATPPYNSSEPPSSSNLIVFVLIGILSVLAILLGCVGVYIYKLSKRIASGQSSDETQIRNRLLADEVVTRQQRTKLEKEMDHQLGEYSRKYEEMKKLQDVDVYENKLKELMNEGYEKEVAMILIHCTSDYEKTLRTSIKDLSKNVEEREIEVNQKIEANAAEALRRENEEQRTRAILKSPNHMFELPGDDTVPEYEGEYLPPSRTVRRDFDLSVIKHEMELAEARRSSISSDRLSDVPSSHISDKNESALVLPSRTHTAAAALFSPASPTKEHSYNDVQGIGRYRTGHWGGNTIPDHPHVKSYVADASPTTAVVVDQQPEQKPSPTTTREKKTTKKPDRNSIGSSRDRGSRDRYSPHTVLTLKAPMPPKPKKAPDGRIMKSVII